MSIHQRFSSVLFHLKKSATQLAKELNVTQSSVSRILNGETLPSSKILVPLLETYPQINSNWLLVGVGEMFLDKNLTHSHEKSNDVNPKDEIKHLRKEVKYLKKENENLTLLAESFKNQLKDKEVIIDLLKK